MASLDPAAAGTPDEAPPQDGLRGVRRTKAPLTLTERLQRFAKARPSATTVLRGPPLAEAKPYWMPKLAGELVRPSGIPENGFGSREEALAGAVAYRDACRAALGSQHPA